MAVGHRLAAFHAACAAKGAEEYCYWARAIHRCLPMRHPHLPLAVSPVCSAVTGGRPRHPGLTTAFPLRDRARRLPCHLAHMELAAMSRPQGQQSPVARTTAGCLTAPIRDSSQPHDTVTIALLAPYAKLAFSLRNPEKAHSQECHSHSTAAVPHDSLVRHGRFREITLPDTLCKLPERGNSTLLIISGVGEGNPDMLPSSRAVQPDVYVSFCGAQSRSSASCARGVLQTVRGVVTANDAQYGFDGATKRCNQFCLICLTLCRRHLSLTRRRWTKGQACGRNETPRELSCCLPPRECQMSCRETLPVVSRPRVERNKI